MCAVTVSLVPTGKSSAYALNPGPNVKLLPGFPCESFDQNFPYDVSTTNWLLSKVLFSEDRTSFGFVCLQQVQDLCLFISSEYSLRVLAEKCPYSLHSGLLHLIEW